MRERVPRARVEPAPNNVEVSTRQKVRRLVLGTESRWLLAGLAVSGGLLLLGLNELALPGLVATLVLYFIREHLL
jgi:hypothetical protein